MKMKKLFLILREKILKNEAVKRSKQYCGSYIIK